MCPLSNTPRSNSDGYLPIQNKTVEEFGGWDDDFDDPAFLKDKDIVYKLIRAANDRLLLTEVFRRYGIVFSEIFSASGWTQRALCPFPDHDERTPSFCFNPEQNVFNCFGCQKSGKAVQFISFMESEEFENVAKKIIQDIGLLKEFVIEQQTSNLAEVEKLLIEYSGYFRKFIQTHSSDKAIEYAENHTRLLDIYLQNNSECRILNLVKLQSIIQLIKNKLESFIL